MHHSRRCLPVLVAMLMLLATPLIAHAATPGPSTPSPSPPPADCGMLCTAGHTAVGILTAPGDTLTNAAGTAVNAATASVTETFTKWVAESAATILAAAARGLDSNSPDLGASWWLSHYATMALIGLALMVPFAMLMLVGAVVRGDLGGLLRGFFVQIPLACLLTGSAVTLTVLLLQATDGLTTYVAGSIQADTTTFLTNLSQAFQGATAGMPTSLFVVALIAILTVLAGILLMLELMIRTAVIYVALLFLPLALAGSIWPPARVWAKRLAETIGVAIISKFVIVAVLGMAAAALAHTVPNTGPSFNVLGSGLVLIGLAAYAPYKLLRLIPVAEHAAAQHLTGASHQTMGTTYQTGKSMITRMLESPSANSAGMARTPLAAAAGAAGGTVYQAAARSVGPDPPPSGGSSTSGPRPAPTTPPAPPVPPSSSASPAPPAPAPRPTRPGDPPRPRPGAS